jgi:hypothetical protein
MPSLQGCKNRTLENPYISELLEKAKALLAKQPKASARNPMKGLYVFIGSALKCCF